MTPAKKHLPAAACIAATAAMALAIGTAQPARAEDEEGKRRIVFGADLGFFRPTSSKTRDAFGNTWTNIGIGIGSIKRASRHGAFAFDLAFVNNNRWGDRRAVFVPIGVSYRQAFTDPEDEEGNARSATPYYGISAGLYLASLRSDKYGVDSNLTAGGGGSVLLGVAFHQNAFVEARYHAISRVKGFDLSGLDLGAGIRF